MLHLRTLGGLALDAGGSAAGVGGQRTRLALLAVLAVGGQSGVSREKLLALFWSDSDAERARGALKQALYALRRHLGEDVIVGTGELRLNPDVISTDVGEFEHAIARGDAEAAVACYAGPFLDGVFLRNSAAFEEWVERERARLARSFCQMLERLASAADQRGDYASAVGWWRRAASVDALSGRIAVSLVRSLARTGDTAGALRQADVYRAMVRQEVGDHADPAMDAVVAAVQSGALCSAVDITAEGSHSRLPASGVGGGESPRGGADGSSARTAEQPPSVTAARAARRWLLPSLALTGVVAALGLSAWQRRVDKLSGNVIAVLTACTQPSDQRLTMAASLEALADLVRGRLANGLADLPNVRVRPIEPMMSVGKSNVIGASGTDDVQRMAGAARSVRARFLVLARCRSVADSMLLSADIVDAEDARVLTTIGPLSAPAAQLEGGVERLRDRVMTAIALRVDPKLKAWVYASNAPSTFESYRELRLGIDAFVATELAEATVHFGKAAALDSASATPLVWAAFARAYYWDTAADSILTELGASHRRMGPWDDAMVGLVKAFRGGDLPLAHRAAHAVASVVPNSEWRVLVASTAMSENRAKEALRVLRAVDPADGWINGWEFYWVTIGQAYHLLGEFREELENDRRALTYWPNNMTLVQFEFKALGSLGWVAELGRRWDEVSGVRLRVPNFGPFGQETAELRAHVGTAAARPFYDRLLAQKRSQLGKGDSVGSDEDIRGGIASDLAMSGRVGAARAVLDSLLPVGQVPAYGLLVLDGEISAMQGDRDRAHRALAELEHPSVGPETVGPTIGQNFPELDRAAIHALLGEKAEAVALIEQATRRGFAYRHVIHIIPGMDLLKGYPPFDALVRPVDSPETPR